LKKDIQFKNFLNEANNEGLLEKGWLTIGRERNTSNDGGMGYAKGFIISNFSHFIVGDDKAVTKNKR
jgi:hypothetical protein